MRFLYRAGAQTAPQAYLAKSDEKSKRSVRESDQKVTENEKNDRTPFADLLLPTSFCGTLKAAVLVSAADLRTRCPTSISIGFHPNTLPECPERHLDAARQKLPRDNFCRSIAGQLHQKGLEICYCLWGVPSRPSPGSYPGALQVPSRVRGGPVQIRHVLCFTVFWTHPGPEVGAIPARPGPSCSRAFLTG